MDELNYQPCKCGIYNSATMCPNPQRCGLGGLPSSSPSVDDKPTAEESALLAVLTALPGSPGQQISIETSSATSQPDPDRRRVIDTAPNRLSLYREDETYRVELNLTAGPKLASSTPNPLEAIRQFLDYRKDLLDIRKSK